MAVPVGGAAARLPPLRTILLTAVPYFTWGNRERGAMRVWIPADA